LLDIFYYFRTYFHSTNNQQLHHLNETEDNSEDEGPPDWLKDKTREVCCYNLSTQNSSTIFSKSRAHRAKTNNSNE